MRFLCAVLLALVGCSKDPEFPSAIPDATYPNGHALATNAVEDLAWEVELVDLTNQRRAQSGLPPLSQNLTLDAVARAHSLHMFEHYFFGHDNPEGDSPHARLQRVASNVPWVVRENTWIVEPGKSPQYVLDGFWASPEHQANILAAGHLIGVGIVRRPYNSLPDHIYVTMEFLELR